MSFGKVRSIVEYLLETRCAIFYVQYSLHKQLTQFNLRVQDGIYVVEHCSGSQLSCTVLKRDLEKESVLFDSLQFER